MTQTYISEGDYSSLVSYSSCLENNYTRLVNLNLEHEMSNTCAMSTNVGKFPRVIAERWTEHLATLTKENKQKPFTSFITWLGSRKEVWQQMAVTEMNQKSQGAMGFFGLDNVKSCHRCGATDHLQRDCPKQRDKPKQINRSSPRVVNLRK